MPLSVEPRLAKEKMNPVILKCASAVLFVLLLVVIFAGKLCPILVALTTVPVISYSGAKYGQFDSIAAVLLTITLSMFFYLFYNYALMIAGLLMLGSFSHQKTQGYLEEYYRGFQYTRQVSVLVCAVIVCLCFPAAFALNRRNRNISKALTSSMLGTECVILTLKHVNALPPYAALLAVALCLFGFLVQCCLVPNPQVSEHAPKYPNNRV